MAKKPNFADIVDTATDPKKESAFLSEAKEDHDRRKEARTAAQETAEDPPRRPVETLSKRANFLLKPSVHARFKNYTQSHYLTMNAVVNELIEGYLKEHNA